MNEDAGGEHPLFSTVPNFILVAHERTMIPEKKDDRALFCAWKE